MSERPLDGVRVADFGQFIAGPAVGQALAELGAVVVKVEPVDGEPARVSGTFGQAMLRTNGRDKLGLALDLRTPEGLEVAERLVTSSDVLVQNMRVGTMERLGLGPDRALELNPRLVYVAITAFGKDASPSRSGFDVAAQAESGMMSVTGEAHDDPQRIGFTVVDQSAAYIATSATLAALFRRERTGRGAVIDTSLLAAAIHVQGPNWTQMFETGVEPRRCGTGQPGAAPASEVVEVRDGAIVLSAYTPAHWLRLCAAIDRPDMPTDPRFASNADRLAHRDALRAALSDALAHRSMADAVALLNDSGVVAAEIRSYKHVVDSDEARRLDAFRDTVGDDSYRYAGPPYSFRDVPAVPSRSAPEVGEHNRAVLSGLGYAATQIDDLITRGVVARPAS